MSAINLFLRLVRLNPPAPEFVGQILVAHGDGTADVELANGGTVRVRNPLGAVATDHVFLRGDTITGQAPAMTVVEVEV